MAALDFAVSLPLWFSFDRAKAGYQFVERASWIPSLGVDYHFGIDGISLLLLLLTTFIGFIAVYCSYSAITERQKEYYVLLLLLQTFMIGTFCCLDFFLFYVFWEIMLVPMYFLIGVWGGQRRLYAAIKFFLYTLAGSVLMLLGIIALYFYNTTGFLGYKGLGHARDVLDREADGRRGRRCRVELQIWLFFAFFFGFAIKVPMFPFHTWLPDAHTEAPTAGSVILAAVLLKMGTYGFVRFSLPMFPEAVKTRWVIGTMVFLAIVGIVYGAMVTLVQKDMKKLIAYSSVSHLGFVMLGIFALNMAGVQGGVPPDDQPRHLDGRALPSRRHRLRAPAHADDRGVRRARAADADLRDVLPDHGALVDGPPALERLHRRVLDPPGGVREELLVGVLRLHRHRARGRVPALALPARLLRRALEPGQREAAGPDLARAADARAARRPRVLDRPVSQAVLRRAAGALGEHRARGRRSDGDPARVRPAPRRRPRPGGLRPRGRGAR